MFRCAKISPRLEQKKAQFERFQKFRYLLYHFGLLFFPLWFYG